MKKEYYGAIDGLRTIACIGIVMMHIATNNSYHISGFLYNSIIPSFTNFVFIFMAVSAFGMCCGYYKKIIDCTICFNDFYGKRLKKALPFFGTLVLLDVIMSPSAETIYEAFADLTLLFGFLPDAGNISVIGVGWFLGLIFVFYICFPFFCVLIQNKHRAWLAFAISLLYNFVCATYFAVGRTNILFSGCFFLTGGLIYLYRYELMKLNRQYCIMIVIASAVLYYILDGNTLACLLVTASWLAYTVICAGDTVYKNSILQNKITKFISSISMEIYLSHMVIFRVIEKCGLNQIIGNGWIQYIVTAIIVFCGTILFAVIMQEIIRWVEEKITRIRPEQ